ncbi:hypothetical protein [Streptomyces litchfieldiae]|uniref:Baseplate protein J-like domain-containing protein n=1 Tax=Streptomyces litchfieldiae TaxID=3075543 RepID=A0ABU2MSZ0_9ACTN|nr:hypothetical protein [Streptomyces sp. DSM 44938]MDT0344517.1 hypothetical protein [Streptomyces sp. DSM 44938]
MSKETIVWTLLPDPEAPALPARTAQLSVVISPRLGGVGGDEPTLTAFEAFINWPRVSYDLSVEITGEDGSATVETEPVDAAPDADLWTAVFPPSTPVRPFGDDTGAGGEGDAAAPTPLLSYPSALVWQSLRQEYADLFAPEPALGARSDADVADAWGRVDRLLRTVRAPRRVGLTDRALTAPDGGALADAADEDSAGWARLAAFHRPPPAGGDADRLRDRRRDELPRDEFHTLVAALADHHTLLAGLGLVRRVRFALPPGLNGRVTLRAALEHETLLTNYLPRTVCVIENGLLRLAGADGARAALHLPLDDTSRYSAADVDVDAGGLALQAYAEALAREPRDGPPPEVRPPALRSDGVWVAEADRQVALKDVLDHAADMNTVLADPTTTEIPEITSEDVQQGYRVDVCDVASERWYPLCRRVGAYTVRNLAEPVPIDDEGRVSDVTARGDGADLLHQSLFRWNGWSLVARPPGGMLDLEQRVAEPTPDQGENPAFTSEVNPPPDTLPSLRYGRAYRFRVRVVDIAGRSAPFTERPLDGEPATAPLHYSRYEPVPAPVLVPRRPFTEGESAHALLVRTDNADPAAPVPGLPCERHLLAPKAAVLLLERHGVLDVPGENRLDPGVHAVLTARADGEVTGTADPAVPDSVFVDADGMESPWLSDPLSRGVALHGLSGLPGLRAPWPPGNAWFERPSVRLVVEPAALDTVQPVSATQTAGVLRLALAPGASLTAPLSSHLLPGDEELLGLWRWFAESGERTEEEIAARRADAVAGTVPQLTPSTELRFVHAVRRPVTPPELGTPAVLRERDASSYVLDAPALSAHWPTTSSVHVEAAWNETVDDLTQDEPRTTEARAVLRPAEEDLRAAWDAHTPGATVPFRAPHHLPDTRHRHITYTPVGTSPFASYFSERRTVVLTGDRAEQVAAAFVPGTVVVLPPAGQGETPYRPDRDVLIDEAAGTVARLAGGGVPDGAQARVSFVVPPVTRAGAAISLHVPSTVRPAPPVVHSVVPAFAWQEERGAGSVISTRRGGLLRVFLERPWFDTGEGELLAVLVGDNVLDYLFREDRRRVTTWGHDPLHEREQLPELPGIIPRWNDVRRAVENFALPNGEHAMGHPVHYDAARRLWYADVELRTHGVYEPFVKLVVARLQPHSLEPDLALSSRVETEPVKVVADRRATVTVAGRTATVTLLGHVAPRVRDGLDPRFTAAVQVRQTDSTDPLAWHTIGAETQLSVAPPPAPGLGQWAGAVELPADPGTRAMRVLLRETGRFAGKETLFADRPAYFDTIMI